MKAPRGEKKEAVDQAIERLKGRGDDFKTFLEWVKSERDRADVDNRHRGFENATTEAEALTTILQVTGFERDSHNAHA